MLLTTNDKTIKLWKVVEKQAPIERSPLSLQPPRAPVTKTNKRYETRVDCRVKKVFAGAHTYHINSVSPNSDGETFLSADDLRINVWNLNVSNQSFNILDIKPANMEELTEVITSCEFHPQQCNTFMYSTSKGAIKLGDMRAAALCDRHTKLFEEPIDASTKSFFSEIISSISDVKFSHDGRYFFSRDYLNIKIWDMNMEGKPVQTFRVHEHLRPKLCDLYENDCIFDKFQASWSGDSSSILTGSYNNVFRVFHRDSGTETALEASRDNITTATHTLEPVNFLSGPAKPTSAHDLHVDTMDYSAKLLHLSWNPARGVIALGATNNLYLFRQ